MLERVALRILLIDDHPLFSEAMRLVVARLSESVTVRSVATAEAALAVLGIVLPYNLIVLDLSLPGLSDEDAFVALRDRAGRTPIVVVTADPDPHRARGLMALGARGYVCKSGTSAELLDTFRRVLAGEVVAPPWMPAADDGAEVRLTRRQLEVLAELARGSPNSEIAKNLAISEATVRVHVGSILRSLKVENRTQAAVTPLATRLSSRPSIPPHSRT